MKNESLSMPFQDFRFLIPQFKIQKMNWHFYSILSHFSDSFHLFISYTKIQTIYLT